MKKIILTIALGLFVTPITNAQDLPSYVPTDGLVAYYPFNGNANDESGNGHHGTVNGATLSSDRDGNIDKAYEFSHDGASFGNNHQSIYIPFHSDFQSENFTVSIWFKADSYGWDGNTIVQSTLFSKRENSSQPNQATYRIQLSSNFTRSEIGGPDGDDEIPCTADSDELNLGAWYHAALSYDGTTLKQYINGVKVSEINCDLSHNAISTSGIMLGQTWQYNGYWYHLDGKLDEFMVYNRSMTEQEMENYYVSATSDIILNGVVSIENNQIKNLADPTAAQDAATKNYVDSNINSFSGSYSDLTDAPTMYTQSEVDALISNLQNQIAILRGDPIDNEGNIYTFKTFGTQTWTTEPAAMETYRDGTVIPQVDSTSDWANLTTGAWCYYENDSSKVKLYNWYAVVGIHDAASLTDVSLRKEFAPEGWHVPSKDELITLIDYFISSGYNYDSTTSFNKIAKAVASKTGWITSTVDGTPGNNSENNNSTGFNLHPHGYRTNTGGFGLSSQAGYFWTVDDAGGGNSVGTLLVYNSVSLGYANSPYAATYSKPFGLSVRLVKD